VLDFVTAWYSKSLKMMQANQAIHTALVSTNSISQGEQVGILWKYMNEGGAVINFAHRTFKWSNDARGVAAVYCVIIGFALESRQDKRIFDYPDIRGEPVEVPARNINPYLVDAPTAFVQSRQKPMCDVPEIGIGNNPSTVGSTYSHRRKRHNSSKPNPNRNASFDDGSDHESSSTDKSDGACGSARLHQPSYVRCRLCWTASKKYGRSVWKARAHPRAG
jgi:hypothetical protein